MTTIQFSIIFKEIEPNLWKAEFPSAEEFSKVPLRVLCSFFHDLSEALNEEPEPKPGLEEVSLRRN